MRIKEALFVGGIAAGFSLLLGLFSGNPFFTVLLRASVVAVVIFCASLAVFFIIERFLPEIIADDVQEQVINGAESANNVSPTVNIVVDDNSEDVTVSPKELDPGKSVSPVSDEVEDFEEDVSELEDIDSSQSGVVNTDKAGYSVTDSDNSASTSDVAGAASDDASALPDVNSLEDDFFSDDESSDDSVELASDTVVSSSVAKAGPEDSSDDPEIMAKAIRTLLKKDEEGT